ncbi:MAG: hypothetical protein IPJ30_10035 [Acidobacteria bacterium]|nr:hypothetical protein [Acidobacteriota bacterium]
MIRTLLILCIAGALSCGIGRPRLQGKWQVISETRIHDVAQRRLIAFFGRKGISLNFSRIEMTPDGGMNWRTVYLADENVALAGGAFFNDSNGIVVGTREFSKPMILRTTDGGDNWETVSYVAGSTNQALDSQGLRAACNLSEGTTIILGETALIRATLTQTAMSAESVFSTSPNQLSQIACSGTDDAWAVGKSPVLFRLNSKGLTSINLPTDLIPNTVRFFDNRLWVVGSTTSKRGYLISSDDLGETWEDRTPSGSSAPNRSRDEFGHRVAGRVLGPDLCNRGWWRNLERVSKPDGSRLVGNLVSQFGRLGCRRSYDAPQLHAK